MGWLWIWSVDHIAAIWCNLRMASWMHSIATPHSKVVTKRPPTAQTISDVNSWRWNCEFRVMNQKLLRFKSKCDIISVICDIDWYCLSLPYCGLHILQIPEGRVCWSLMKHATFVTKQQAPQIYESAFAEKTLDSSPRLAPLNPKPDAWFSSLEFWKPIANKSARRACSWRFSLRNSCGMGCNMLQPKKTCGWVRDGQKGSNIVCHC